MQYSGSQINIMMDEPVSESELDFDSRRGGNLPSNPGSSNPSADFLFLNEAYHLAVLLQLYQRVMKKPLTDAAVQQAVKRGVRCMRNITLYECASPGVATLQPIFILGCAAQDGEVACLSLTGWRR